MKLSELKKANKNINSFCEDFGAKITITNEKGVFMARVTKKSVQIFVLTGENILDCMIKASERIDIKRKQLGR